MKDPAFLFYPSDFIIGTMDMTDEEVGVYIRLLCRQFLKGNIEPKIIENLSDIILSKFCEDSKGNFYNKRLKLEKDKRKKYTESRRANRSKVSQKGKHMKNICETHDVTYEKHMENENINENININKDLKYNVEIEQIVEYLNEKCGSRYKATSQKTKTLIKARLQEGFTVSEFEIVIDKKSEEWVGTEYQKFLRPETLFGTKFESYLNQQIAPKKNQLHGFYDMTSEWAKGEQ